MVESVELSNVVGIGIGMEREQCQFVMAGEGFDQIGFHHVLVKVDSI